MGCLKSKIENWENKAAESVLLDVLRSGYKLTFKTIPPYVELKHSGIVNNEIEQLLDKGCIK